MMSALAMIRLPWRRVAMAVMVGARAAKKAIRTVAKVGLILWVWVGSLGIVGLQG